MLAGDIGPITFTSFRFAFSTVWFLLAKPYIEQYTSSTEVKEKRSTELVASGGVSQESGLWSFLTRDGLLKWIFISGLSNFGGSMLQQFGLVTVSASKVGFITGSYVVVIPFIEWLAPCIHGHRIQCLSWKIWVGAFICLAGLYLISGCTGQADSCLDNKSTRGEYLVMGSVLFWIINLMAADAASKQVDCLSLTLGEFVIVTVLTTISALIFEPQYWIDPLSHLYEYLGIFVLVGLTEAGAFLLSTIGQTYVRPSRASILYSVGESLSASIMGFIFLGEIMHHMEMLGGLLLLLASMISSSEVSDEEDAEEAEVEVEGEKLVELSFRVSGGATAAVPVDTRPFSVLGGSEPPTTHFSSGENMSSSRSVAYNPLLTEVTKNYGSV